MSARYCAAHVLALIALIVSHAEHGYAQPSNPWNGVAFDEARPAGPVQWDPWGVNAVSPRALSGDGRYVVFASRAQIVADDLNGEWDIYLRDRQTGVATRISVAADGVESNGVSSWPTISADGRQIAFSSCATNLVGDDTNELCDLFVYDRDQGTTLRVNLGPDGQESTTWDSSAIALSGTGRYVLFVSAFELAPFVANQRLWLRDRDSDADGLFDESDSSTLTEIPAAVQPDLQLFGYGWITLSDDGRYVVFNPDAYTTTFAYLGSRLFLHDRESGITVQVGDAPANVRTHTTQPDLSNAGHLVYVSDVPNVVPGDDDFDSDLDVFVFNFLSGEHRRLQLNHQGAPGLSQARTPAISGDGRYVTFVGVHVSPEGNEWSNVYAFDRELATSYDVSLKPDGLRVDMVDDYPSISDDGMAIAFGSQPYMLVEGWGNAGVFVATGLSLPADPTTMSPEGGSVHLDITAPANTAWAVTSLDFSVQQGLLMVSPTGGVGSGTLEVTLPPNYTEDDREYWIIIGSEFTIIRQPAAPSVWWVDPGAGPLTGGTPVTIFGTGFKDGATVTFGDRPATDVWVENNAVIRALTPSYGTSAAVDIVVTNPTGAYGSLASGFTYFDATPPVIASTVTGTLGLNGWYTSDVAVQWTVRDDESPLQYEDCDNLLLTHDATIRVGCNAQSEGGRSSAELHVNRDTAPPTAHIASPEERVYRQGEVATVSFICKDALSGISHCGGPVPSGSPLDTSVPGSYAFVVTAEDHAGHRTTTRVKYVVKAMPVVTWTAPAAITYGTALNSAQLNATADVPGTFTYKPAVGAALAAGSHQLSVTFTPADAGLYFTATATVAITVGPAPLSIIAGSAVMEYGQTVPGFTATATEFVNGDSFASLLGGLAFVTPATAASAPGSYPISVSGVSSPNYTIRFVGGTLTIVPATTTLSLAAVPNPERPRQETVLTATVVFAAPHGQPPGGVVEFRENGELLGTAPVSDGVATLTHRFRRPSATVTATYSGDVNFAGAAMTATFSTK